MIYKTYLFILILTLGLFAQWPDNLSDLQESLCLVEYYQPQYEVREIKDDSRIKMRITGILVNDKGLVMTSDIIFPAKLDIVSRSRFYTHMQSKPEDITVIFEQEKKLKAELIGIDEEYRVAFIQITEYKDLPDPVEFETEFNSTVGDEIYLIQHLNERFNREPIITDHRINAIIKKPLRKILTTGSFVPNSAGGIAADRDGRAIGVVFRSSEFVPSYDYDIDFSGGGSLITQILPGSYLNRLISNPPRMQLQKNGTGKSWLGIRMQILKKEMAEYWDIPETRGIIINSVVPQSPAEKVGLQTGDIVTNINGFKVQGDKDQDLELFRNYIRSLPEGSVQLSYIRDKQRKTTEVELESAPISKFFAEEYSEEFLRFSVKELTQDIILENDLDFDIEGVWVSRVEEAGAASLSGMMVHDLILSINDRPVKNLSEFKSIMTQVQKQNPEYVQIFIQRTNKTLFLFVTTSYADSRITED